MTLRNNLRIEESEYTFITNLKQVEVEKIVRRMFPEGFIRISDIEWIKMETPTIHYWAVFKFCISYHPITDRWSIIYKS